MKTKSTLSCLLFAVCTNTCISIYAQAVNKQDSLALVDLYNSTGGAGWEINDNWLIRPVKTWYGITVTDTRVTRISLSDENLEGKLPASLGNLVNLTYLDLTSNQLRGSIPSSLGNLVKLNYLFLPYNYQLSGSIPSSFGNLVNLRALWLASNQLSGSIPSSIGNLVHLTELNLSNNQLSGTIPSSFGNLIHLTYLWIGNNQLSGRIPSSIGNLVNLTSLDLGENQLSWSIPSSFGNIVNLVQLYLGSNRLSGGIPSSFANLVNLQELSVGDNQVSGSIPASLGNLVNLHGLYLANNQLSGSIPSSLGNLVNLISLKLNDNQLSGSIPSSLGNLVNLAFLYLNTNQLSGSIPSELGNLVKLQELNLNHNKLSGIIPPTIANLQERLYALDLSYNRFTFTSMQFVQQTFPFAIYGNQARIPVHQKGNTLYVSAGGTLKNNTYKWFKVGQTGNTTIKGDSVFHPLQSGKYFANVTNSVAIKLILKTDTLNYVASSLSNTTTIASSENALQQQDKTNLFLAYPNPARDILHVQTNGKVSFSLLNQSGQILLTTNINGKGSINVSSMAAGLYYLKNNSTGAVQKVIIAR